ncbi:hypothetical protein MO973_17210 [Paenibacillus sp. TRM 82003]|uniref:hypothetical protein n=1 Tax=Kineococcus sp. TRM81007 TaxID=2925831 RepID=UPI001F56F102|nr:hypothetical protein [Kineococcus sp. TRM81007]MCI2238515.1 hypothetical protein [Kineococcus sp. TRM81007]MCI3921972.1 hypothetical protein [Paenibacillus sp. TRM 82003]
MRKLVGAALAVLLVAAVAALFVLDRRSGSADAAAGPVTTLRGVIGSEKEAFFDDPRVREALSAHGLAVEVDTAGSRQIATDVDLGGYDFAFPSSAPAAQRIAEGTGATSVSSPFWSPMVVATHEPVVQLLARNGAASRDAGGVWHLDLAAYLAMVREGTRWDELEGAAQLYDSPRAVLITSTDVRTSNSAAMYLADAAWVLNGGGVVTTREQQEAVLPQLSHLFLAQGFSAASSDEPFGDYLSQGAGALPLVMAYEAQFVGEAARGDGSRLGPDAVLAYPDPTVASKHTLVALDPGAERLAELLATDPDLTALAAEHGFRTGDGSVLAGVAAQHGVAVQQSLTDVADPPSFGVLEALIDAVAAGYGE